ncbi:SDR family NAD(P)-dependent oxidoreductase [Rhodococcus sp. NPDC059968]|uniref:SDR family NAD(P)-dependent oxidoreductase n=1 Tax=Rhodococcus sp. NPDC059968 TaxID=3347017 RepID=UPI00366B5D90
MTARLQDLVCLVSGSHQGIGAAIVEAYRAEGAVVVSADWKNDDATVDDRYWTRRLDVTRKSEWQSLTSEITASFGRIDVLINNAGTTGWASIHDVDDTEWDRIIDVNQRGTHYGMASVAEGMISRRQGSIINISSIFGSRAVANLAAYHASKAAVLGMTRNASITYAPHAVRANAILPGWIATPMTAGQDDELNQEFIGRTPMKRGGTPNEIATAAVFLGSNESSFVTGAELPVDGGYLAL